MAGTGSVSLMDDLFGGNQQGQQGGSTRQSADDGISENPGRETPKNWKGPCDVRECEGSGDYPNYSSWKTRSGHSIMLDDSEGKESLTIQHRSGSSFQMLPNGAVHLVSNHGAYNIVFGENRMVVSGAHDVTVKGDTSIRTYGDVNHTHHGDYNHTVTGDYNLTARNMNSTVRGSYEMASKDINIKNEGNVSWLNGGAGYFGTAKNLTFQTGQSMNFGSGASTNFNTVKHTTIKSGGDFIGDIGGQYSQRVVEATNWGNMGNFNLSVGSLGAAAGAGGSSSFNLKTLSGAINAQSSTAMNFNAGAALNAMAGAAMNMKAGAALNAMSGAAMNLKSGADLLATAASAMGLKSGMDMNMSSGSSINQNASQNITSQASSILSQMGFGILAQAAGIAQQAAGALSASTITAKPMAEGGIKTVQEQVPKNRFGNLA